MNFKHLATFIEVADSASFSIAATRLHTVQSAISRHINALEESLEVTLLERSTRHVSLTPAGETFLKHAKDILMHCETAKSAAQLVSQGKQGVLRIGYLSSACAHFLPDDLRRFSRFAPDVDIKIYDMSAGEQLRAFSNGMLDIGFSRPIDSGFEGLLKQHHISDDPIIVAVSDDHALASEEVIGLSQLTPYPLTLFSRLHAPTLFDYLIGAFHQYGIQPHIRKTPSSMQALLTQVSSGSGIALVPSCVKNLQTQGCRFIPLNIELSVALEMHWQAQPSATAQAWVDWYLQNVMAKS